MIKPLTIAVLLFFLTPGQINAWWPFGPKNCDDCILKYQKEAKCERASYMINLACTCKFDMGSNVEDPKDPFAHRFIRDCPAEFRSYNSAVWDCILDNIGNAQNEQAANAIFRSCISKYNK